MPWVVSFPISRPFGPRRRYLKKSADVKPEYSGQVVAMGRLHPTAETKLRDAEALKKQAAGRKVAAYDSKAQNARHVHFPAGGKHRLLNHFYAFGSSAIRRSAASIGDSFEIACGIEMKYNVLVQK